VLPMAVLGVATAGVTLASGSVLGAIALHAAWNAAALIHDAPFGTNLALPAGAAIAVLLASSALGLRADDGKRDEGKLDPEGQDAFAS